MKRIIILGLLFGFLSPFLKAQDTTAVKKGKWLALPLVFFTPETNWGFGGAGIYSFRFAKDRPEDLPSQLQLGFAYTLRKQVLSYLPFQLFLQQGQYKLYGELGYYRYVYEYFGVGNEGFFPESELYTVNYPRVRLNALYQIQPRLFVGFRYWMDDFNIEELAAEGELANVDIPGNQGSFLSGAGIVMNYDTRDRIFYPSKGFFIETVLFHNGSNLGSDFNFSKLYLDASVFKSIQKRHILGLHFYAELTKGEAPFNQLSLLGGTKRLRGYYEGYLRDQHFMMVQGEYRFPLFWRFGGVIFAGVGRVANKFSEFSESPTQYLQPSLGFGLRFVLDQKEQVNLRLDAGFGKNSTGYYLTVSEAF